MASRYSNLEWKKKISYVLFMLEFHGSIETIPSDLLRYNKDLTFVSLQSWKETAGERRQDLKVLGEKIAKNIPNLADINLQIQETE